MLIIDPGTRTVRWLGLTADASVEIQQSSVIELGPEALAVSIDWPPTD